MSKVFLLLLESEDQYVAYLKQKSKFETHNLVVCCLSTSAIDFCKKSPIPFILPEDCYTEEESNFYRKLSEQRVKELVRCLNEFYHKEIGNINGFWFDIGNYHYFMLYHFFGALHYRAFFLWKVIEKYRPDQILISQEINNLKEDRRSFPVSQYANCYLDLCLNSIYREKVIPLAIGSVIVRRYSTLPIRTRTICGKILRKFKPFNNYLNLIQNNIQNGLRKAFFSNSTDILLLGSSGPWKYIFSDIRLASRINARFENDDSVIAPLKSIKNWFLEWFKWEDVFCGFTVSNLGHHEMARVKIMSDRFVKSHKKALQETKRQKVLIYSVCPYASQQYLLSLAKYLNIPRLCFQHGEMSLYYPGLWNESSELLYMSHYFAYGNEVSKEKTNSSLHIDGFKKAISIGSPALDKLKNKKSNKEYILYASSKYLNYGGFISRYADIAVNTSQNILVDYFHNYLDLNPGTKVIWKLNQERLTLQPTKLSKRISIIRDEQTFTDLLPDAQIVILDRPSTTSLETCMTDKPLFVLIAGKNWYSLPEKLLKKRAVVTYTPNELRDAVDAYLQRGEYPADVKNREFVRAYGCHLDDGLSAHRAVNELLNIIGEQ